MHYSDDANKKLYSKTLILQQMKAEALLLPMFCLKQLWEQ